jgi:hypothetical protein
VQPVEFKKGEVTYVIKAGGTLQFTFKELSEMPEDTRSVVAEGMAFYGKNLTEQMPHLEHVKEHEIETVSEASARTATLLLGHRNLRGDLSKERFRAVSAAAEEVFRVLVEQAHLPDVSTQQLESQAQSAVDAFNILVYGRSHQLQSVVEALEPAVPEDPDAIDTGDAEARGRLRLQTLYRKLVRESYTVQQLHDEWGLSRQRLKQLRDEERLFAVQVPYQKSFLYPAWQFRPGSPEIRPTMRQLITTAKESGMDAISFHQIMTNPAAGNGTAPIEMLDQGRDETVIAILRANDV